MKATDKFPEEMLKEVREQANKTSIAAEALFWTISRLRETYPTYRPVTLAEWLKFACDVSNQLAQIADDAEEMIDADEDAVGVSETEELDEEKEGGGE